MKFRKNYLYFLVNKLDELNLDYVKKIGAILVLRNPEKLILSDLKKFKRKCSQNKIDLYISNNVKILFHLRSNNFYVSAYNKKQYSHLRLINKRINIIGSAHNYFEINEKTHESISHLKKSIQINPNNAYSWYLLARAYALVDEIPLANYATAERYYLIGERELSFEFAMKAHKKVKIESPEWYRTSDLIQILKKEVSIIR